MLRTRWHLQESPWLCRLGQTKKQDMQVPNVSDVFGLPVAPCYKISLVFCFAQYLRTLSGIESLILYILSQRFSSTAGGLWPVPKRFSLGCFSLDLIKHRFPAVCVATVLFFHVQADGSTAGRIRRSWSRSHIQQFETHWKFIGARARK